MKRHPMHLRFRLTLAAGLMACVTWATAAPVVVGQPLPTLAVKDQHDQVWQVPATAELLIYSASREASSRLQAILKQQGPDFLASRRAVYLANMSRMPAFITRTMALPSLRDEPFRLGVVMDDKLTADWPVKDDAVTLITLKEGKVTGIVFATDDATVRRALCLPAP